MKLCDLCIFVFCVFIGLWARPNTCGDRLREALRVAVASNSSIAAMVGMNWIQSNVVVDLQLIILRCSYQPFFFRLGLWCNRIFGPCGKCRSYWFANIWIFQHRPCGNRQSWERKYLNSISLAVRLRWRRFQGSQLLYGCVIGYDNVLGYWRFNISNAAYHVTLLFLGPGRCCLVCCMNIFCMYWWVYL